LVESGADFTLVCEVDSLDSAFTLIDQDDHRTVCKLLAQMVDEKDPISLRKEWQAARDRIGRMVKAVRLEAEQEGRFASVAGAASESSFDHWMKSVL